MKNTAELVIDELGGDDCKLQEWLDFMFQNDPIAASIKDWCMANGQPESRMFRLICVGFMRQKIIAQTKAYVAEADKTRSLT